MHARLHLGQVPFYWRIKTSLSQSPTDIPARLPFEFSFNEELQLIIQTRSHEVLQWLERVYKEDANVGYLQEGHTLADAYGGEFLEFFATASALLSKSPVTAADIGCGGVFLLQQLKKQGLSVTGIDPSPVTAQAGGKAGIEIISDFYPSPALKQRFDVLFHYDVLEHVEDPVSFLRAHHANLSADGGLIFAVPDCTHHIKLGDVSMLLHEHLNYFDEESLRNTVRAAGFEPRLLRAARHGGVLMCFATPAVDSRQQQPVLAKGSSKFCEFREKVESALARFERLAGSIDESHSLGLYVPLRAFPYLGGIPKTTRIRFFDDDPRLHGCYYDGFAVPVESFADLTSNPPEHLVICSLAFGEQIANRLSDLVSNEMRLAQWSELFS